MTGLGGVERVLQVHTRYRQAGGEDAVVEAERRLLETAGVSVSQVLFDNADLRDSRSVVGDARLAAGAIWSRDAQRRVWAAVDSHRPDVVHVHNTFAAASPSVFVGAARTAVVHTLHNYRMVCPVATVFRDGRACTDCVGRLVPWPGVWHACVRGSRSQSAVAAMTSVVHHAAGTFRGIDAYVALTEFQRGVMIAGGLPPAGIRVVPNFIDPDPAAQAAERSGVLYVGRLAEEKGIEILLGAAAAAPGILRVVGTGPLEPDVRAAARSDAVDYVGGLHKGAVIEELGRAIALVVPSLWFEGFPLTVAEAYAMATPVVASRLGSLAEIVIEGVTGLLVDPHDSEALAARLRWVIDHPVEMARMGLNARAYFERHLTGPAHLASLLDVYGAAMDSARARVATGRRRR